MIIMLSGKAGAGKDTAYKLINEIIPATRFAFADTLKDFAKQLGWDGKKDIKGRKLLQNLGNTVRDYDEDTWANIVVNKIKEEKPKLAVITDLRFPNEIKVVKSKFSDVITVNITGREYNLGMNGSDISEHALDKYASDFTIFNKGTKEEFKDNLNKLLITLKVV